MKQSKQEIARNKCEEAADEALNTVFKLGGSTWDCTLAKRIYVCLEFLELAKRFMILSEMVHKHGAISAGMVEVRVGYQYDLLRRECKRHGAADIGALSKSFKSAIKAVDAWRKSEI